MFSPSHLKTLHPLQASSVKSSSSSLSSMKLKSLIHTLIVSRMCRIIRALSKVKTIIVEILGDNQSSHFHSCHKKHYTMNKKIILGSFRLHYNWCSSKSSHVLPVPAHVYQELPSSAATNSYYDATWNVPCEQHQLQGEECPEAQLAGYLQWLEDKGSSEEEKQEINEIDVLAEMFIANCHEKFKLEKQESDRRFHEMLARSV
ncbi:uncharacterized protein LOC129297985 [Prosopis cineraria]|uniref:uncharacterized protein LOC129294800 n=1 Tax=Prosopis cineraria TaxID=364024 RepID=UPI00240EDC42|nr:uncharacterized protein LOC129294800 [Prosopis cineraria]XP_054792337.1 uncharacterized protein LOC129297985 [Prosopis cineraria]